MALSAATPSLPSPLDPPPASTRYRRRLEGQSVLSQRSCSFGWRPARGALPSSRPSRRLHCPLAGPMAAGANAAPASTRSGANAGGPMSTSARTAELASRLPYRWPSIIWPPCRGDHKHSCGGAHQVPFLIIRLSHQSLWIITLSASHANEPSWPPKLFQVPQTSCLVREHPLEAQQVLRKVRKRSRSGLRLIDHGPSVGSSA